MGALAATVTSWIYLTKPDLSMIINGVLAGLVAITGPSVYPWYGTDSGPLAGLFPGGERAQILIQLLGIMAVAAFTVLFSLVSWLIIKASIGIRVSAAEEENGLDLGEHAMDAYPEFEITH